jgi:RHS repeat-associated protein
MLGVRVTSGSTVTTRYFHTDNLGSIAVITDETGAVVERDGYDAWGKRRFPTGADDPTGSLTSQATRGFTGQEELADVGLVHLNGRVYDPLIARMTSADPMVPDPMNGQTWNRYSYVINNPLAFTDPSGYCFLGLCGSIDQFFTRLFNEAGRILRRPGFRSESTPRSSPCASSSPPIRQRGRDPTIGLARHRQKCTSSVESVRRRCGRCRCPRGHHNRSFQSCAWRGRPCDSRCS